MRLFRAFTAHPASVGESYFEHLFAAAGFSLRMIGGGIACLIHSLLPFLFVHAGSDCVSRLYGRMMERRRTGSPAATAASRAS